MRPIWPKGGLWRHSDFLKLWSAETISQVGSQVTGLALPFVAIVTLDVSAFEVALLGVVEFAPFILISLPAGVWVDRWPRRPILIVGDLGRAVLLASIPIAYGLDVLTIWQLYVVGFAVGVLTVFFDVAYMSYLPSLVSRDQLIDGNSKLEISRSGAQLAGPAIAGGLVQAITAPFAILVDAVSFVASGLFVLRIRKHEDVSARVEGRSASTGMRAELSEGLRYVLGHRYLRWIAASTATFNFFGNVMWTMFLVYAVRDLGLGAGTIGIIFAIGSAGYLVGALTTNRIAPKLGVGPAIVVGAATGVAALLVPLAPESDPIPYLVAAQVVTSFGVVLYNVTQGSFRQAITPERLQGRMNSVMRFIVWGVMPLGMLVGGFIASAFDLRAAIWVGAIGISFAFLPVLLSPVRTLREMPEQVTDPLAEAEGEGGRVMPGQMPAVEEPS
ncbi:MAG: MFS transporter [Gaiellaceae bacterium]